MYVLAGSQRPSGPGLDKSGLNSWCEKPLEWVCSKQRAIQKGTRSGVGGTGRPARPARSWALSMSCSAPWAAPGFLFCWHFSKCIYSHKGGGGRRRQTPWNVPRGPEKGRWETPEFIKLMKIKIKLRFCSEIWEGGEISSFNIWAGLCEMLSWTMGSCLHLKGGAVSAALGSLLRASPCAWVPPEAPVLSSAFIQTPKCSPLCIRDDIHAYCANKSAREFSPQWESCLILRRASLRSFPWDSSKEHKPRPGVFPSQPTVWVAPTNCAHIPLRSPVLPTVWGGGNSCKSKAAWLVLHCT